jgi:hypothetical protein
MIILDGLKELRNSKIKAILDVVYDLITKFTAEGENQCDGFGENAFTCDAMMLGSLLKGCAQIGIWPELKAPYTGQTFKDLKANIQKFKLIDLGNYNKYHVGHDYSDVIQASLESVEDEYGGLDLWEVKQRR